MPQGGKHDLLHRSVIGFTVYLKIQRTTRSPVNINIQESQMVISFPSIVHWSIVELFSLINNDVSLRLQYFVYIRDMQQK
jgi:Na+/H+ antiporter NhaA